ncbi:MAG: MAPEG family protein [Alphaproteobacteria bacterium]|nr:MAPEG family protein [Alphaproteobacteria bacterium]
MPVVSSFYAALIGILCVVLSVLVIRLRVSTKISIGDGGDKVLSRMTRVFGNFIEYAPLVVVMLALAETMGTSRLTLHIFGLAFIVGRIAHAFGLYRTLGVNPGRTIGVVLTLGTILGLAITLLMIAIPKLS